MRCCAGTSRREQGLRHGERRRVMSTARKTARRLRVGDWVTFPFGSWRPFAQVIEDRGRLGVKGRRIYRLRLDQDESEPWEFELNEEEVEAANPDRTAVLRFLREG